MKTAIHLSSSRALVSTITLLFLLMGVVGAAPAEENETEPTSLVRRRRRRLGVRLAEAVGAPTDGPPWDPAPPVEVKAEAGDGTTTGAGGGGTRSSWDATKTTTTTPPPKHRVWIQYKRGASRNLALSSLQSVLTETLGVSPKVAKTMVEDDSPSAERAADASVAFKMHYDFFGSNLTSMVLTVDATTLKAIKKDPNVLKVEEDVKRYPIKPVGVGDSSSSDLMGKKVDPHRHVQRSEYIPAGVVMTQANKAWDLGYKGQGVKVCVIDSGLDLYQGEFVTSWRGFSTNVGRWYEDTNGHGTHATGTIAARLNGKGVVGVAPSATIVTYRVLNTAGEWAYSSTLVKAVLDCHAEGAKVINMSLQGPKYSSSENTVFQSLYNKGVVSVAAAGNSGTTAHSYPASYANVVSVAAIDNRNRLASFSQRNSGVDLSAHGVDVLSTYPTRYGSYAYANGTSMACPHVAGVAALLFSKSPSASASTIVKAMTSTAQDLGTPGRDNSYGYGMVNAYKALSRV